MMAQNQLVDVLAHVPGFLHDQEEFKETGKELLRQRLVHKIRHQLSTTYVWRSQWEKLNQDAAWEVDHEPDYPLLGLIQSRPFSKVLVCSSWRQATEITLYNAVVLSLLGILWSLEPSTEELPVCYRKSQSPLLLPNQISSLEQVAIEICRIFEFQLSTASQGYGLCLQDTHLPTRSGVYSASSASESTQMNFILRGVWLRLWPSFALI